MKRSEMVKDISDILIMCCKGYNPSSTDSKYDADFILTHIELMGMLSPKAIVKDPGQFPGDAFEYEINEWEPEDEAK